MSPEQAKGQEVDKRSDIWAFGCCLYEALVGAPPLVGDSTSETIANVLKMKARVKVIDINGDGKIRLSKKVLDEDSKQRSHRK